MLPWLATADPRTVGEVCVVFEKKCHMSLTYTASESSPDPDASSPDASPLPPEYSYTKHYVNTKTI